MLVFRCSHPLIKQSPPSLKYSLQEMVARTFCHYDSNLYRYILNMLIKNTWARISKIIKIISYCHTGRNVG